MRQALPQLSWGSKFQCDYVPLILERLQENVQEIECNGEEVGKQCKVDPLPSKRPRKSSWEGIQEHINMLEDHAVKAEAKLKNERDCRRKLEYEIASMKELLTEEFTTPNLTVGTGQRVADAVNKALHSRELLGIHKKMKA